MVSQSQLGEKSIIQFMPENEDKTDLVKKIYVGWKEVLDRHEIHHQIRQRFDRWFMKCYKERDNGKYSMLFEEFLKEEPGTSEDFLLKQEYYVIQRNSCAKEWVQKAIDCVKDERELMQRCIEAQNQTADKKAFLKLEADVNQAKQLHKEIELSLSQSQNLISTKAEQEDKKEDSERRLSELKEVIKRKHKDSNGRILDKHSLESSIDACNNELRRLTKEIQDQKNFLIIKIDELMALLNNLVSRLLNEVKNWQKHYQLKYADLASSRKIEDIETWCAEVGLILYEQNHARLPKWQELYFTPFHSKEEMDMCNAVSTKIHEQMCFFISRTFIVTEQEDFIVKTDKKYLPKIKVRILALDKVDLTGIKIFSYFAREEDINRCFTDTFNLVTLGTMSHELIQNKLTVCRDKKNRDKFEVIFDKLAFKGSFNRNTQEKKPFVHEEKYRVLFHTKVEDMDIITLSLPLVVTTGANQGCCALASIMWQCYSTDVFELPIQCRPSLPWKDIAGILKLKISKLSSHQQLSPENITHLKRRLLSSEHKPDDTEVSLNQFCFDKMYRADNSDEQHQFSFWKWFLANYNLLDKYLKQYWEDNLIGGFLSKDDVEKMFKKERIQKNGTFILRFSDTHINDSQGINSVFGYLTAMVTTRVEEDGEKKYKIHSTEVADHKKLKEKNLANILKESLNKGSMQIYQHLFPNNRPREMYFDKYCKEGTVVDGYTGRHDAFIVDLEQDLCALKIGTGKHRRPSIDSGIMSPSDGGTKRVRGQTDSYPTIKNLLSYSPSMAGSPSPHSIMSSPQSSPMAGSPSHHSIMSSPQPSPMPYSPDSATSPAAHPAMYDPVSPANQQSIQSQLPTMLQSGILGTDDGSQHKFCTISPNDLQDITSSCQGNSGLQQQQCVVLASSGTNGNIGTLTQPPGMRVVTQNIPQDVSSYQFGANFNGISENGQLPDDYTRFPNEFAVTCSSPINPACQQVTYVQQELLNLSHSNPQAFQEYLSQMLCNLPSAQLQVLQQTFSSQPASPAHPAMEMDNTPSDFIGKEFMLSFDEFENGNHANSGNIDVSIFGNIQDEANNM